VKDIDFRVDFVAGNSNKLQKLGLEGKVSRALNVFTLGSTAQAKLVSYLNHILLLKVKCAFHVCWPTFMLVTQKD
jgi:hypothetical protein